MNQYFIGRTGRFYYNFEFQNLELEEIKEYLQDSLDDLSILKRLTSLLTRLNVNYDQLQSIVRELNLGETIENILNYLNLGLDDYRDNDYEVTFQLKTGDTYTYTQQLNPFAEELEFYIDDYLRIEGVKEDYCYDFKVFFSSEHFAYEDDHIKLNMSGMEVDYDRHKGYTESDNNDNTIFRKVDDVENITVVRKRNDIKHRFAL